MTGSPVVPFAFFLLAAVPGLSAAQVPVDREVHLMGTTARLEIHSRDRASGLVALERMIGVLEVAEQELSTWKEGSALSRLNRHPQGSEFPVEAALCALFRELAFWHNQTGGAFDPAVGRLIESWGLNGTPRRPGAEELTTARLQSGFEHLEITERSSGCVLTRVREVILNSGGFAKGAGLDRLLHDTRDRRETDPWMVDLGGQVMVSSPPSGGRAWAVALAHPRERHRPVRTLWLTSGSLATSGGSESDLGVGGTRVGHVLDPQSGETVVSDGAVVVWHESALVADILSTALYVMGPEQGLKWSERQGIAASFLIPHRDVVDSVSSSRFQDQFPD